MTEPDPRESVDEFRARALAWLEGNAKRKPADLEIVWGQGSDSVALFQNLSHDEEGEHIDAGRAWIRQKADAGFAHLTWPVEWGGQGLPKAYARAFAELESEFVTPPGHEAIGITTDLIAPTIRAVGTDEQRQRFLPPMLRTDEMWCQLFSEPGAGSDVAGLTTRAERDGDQWVLNGQKVWTSGAQFADWGYIICRTDPAVPKHRGLTAFVVPMHAPGVEVRPLRQASGGSSFNEVFFTDVRIPHHHRLGDVGEGWRVALTTLGFERSASSGEGTGSTVRRLVALAQHLDRNTDPVIRQHLARAYCHQQVGQLTTQRVKVKLNAGETPGPEGSLGKLSWTEGLRLINAAAAAILGPRLVVDTGEWGTYAWSEHLMGTAGYRVAGGTDEIQRNIISERVLGLPGEPRVDRDVPFNQVPRSG